MSRYTGLRGESRSAVSPAEQMKRFHFMLDCKTQVAVRLDRQDCVHVDMPIGCAEKFR